MVKVRRIAMPPLIIEELNCHICACYYCHGQGFIEWGSIREDCDCIYYGDHEPKAKNCQQNTKRNWMTGDEMISWLKSMKFEEEEE